MSARVWFFVAALVWMFPTADTFAAETAKPASFAQAVIRQAVSFMPAELKTKLSPLEKDMATAAKSTLAPGQAGKEPCYFVDKQEGSGPLALAEQFRAVRKKLGERAPYAALAPSLGKLAGNVIALCQPYHTNEAAFKDPKHAAFEKGLDAACSSLKADFDGYQKVDNPSEFAVRLAEHAHGLLDRLKSAEGENIAGVQSAVFALASNGVVDCWWTLLAGEKTRSSEEIPATGNYIGNKRSLKFHLPTCRYLPAEKNRVYFKTRDEAINEGFVPCKVCKP